MPAPLAPAHVRASHARDLKGVSAHEAPCYSMNSERRGMLCKADEFVAVEGLPELADLAGTPRLTGANRRRVCHEDGPGAAP